MVLEGDSSGLKQPRSVAFHASTALLALALIGWSLRLSGGGAFLVQHSVVAAVLLVRMAPIWAMLGSLAATIYLVFSMWRPYSAAQHLIEMVAGVLLVVLMLPVF